ncbi:MAG: nucleotidyltransferase domain-containing protein [Synechococcaceae bacterium WB9_2_170]|nr:nucleotidyltransferase domain-containing protein [Synechococcaceae bacterium WB9_2_170]
MRLFGSRVRGETSSTSDLDLLITVSDHWLAQHERCVVLDWLRWRLSKTRSPGDLLPFSESQVAQSRRLCSNVVFQAYAKGLRLDG